jgi:hypothetical protein
VSQAATLLRTPLHEAHLRLGARMVPFAGYEMPVQYRSIVEEHRTVRSAVGLFDLSHMGELLVRGPEALAFVRYALVSDPGRLEPWQAQYSMLCDEAGGIIDDLICYRTDEGYLIVCNAANRGSVAEHLEALVARGDFDAAIDDRSARTALVAPQGPLSAELLARLTDLDLERLGNYRSMPGAVAGVDCLVARTGYTGEDGFELFCDARRAARLWDESHSGTASEDNSDWPNHVARLRSSFVDQFPHVVDPEVATTHRATSLQPFVDVSPDGRVAVTLRNDIAGGRFICSVWDRVSGRLVWQTERPGTGAAVRFTADAAHVGPVGILDVSTTSIRIQVLWYAHSTTYPGKGLHPFRARSFG